MDIHYMMRYNLGVMNDIEPLNADSNLDYSSFSYTFRFQDEEVLYRYDKYANQKLKYEELIINNVSCTMIVNLFLII